MTMTILMASASSYAGGWCWDGQHAAVLVSTASQEASCISNGGNVLSNEELKEAREKKAKESSVRSVVPKLRKSHALGLSVSQ